MMGVGCIYAPWDYEGGWREVNEESLTGLGVDEVRRYQRDHNVWSR